MHHRLTIFVVLASGVGLVLYACTSEPIRPEPGAATGDAHAGSPGFARGQGGDSSLSGQGGAEASAGKGIIAGQGGDLNTSGQGGETAGSAFAGQAGNDQAGSAGSAPKDCPTQGTAMVRLASPKGVPYCIDRTEVTQAQYQLFLDATKGDLSGQDSFCAQTNFTYKPAIEDTPGSDVPGCPASRWDPKGTPDNPIECVDLCDARMYCRSVGKRLCGKIGGGEEKYDEKTINDPEQSQWYNACSEGGKNTFAYGTKANPELCSDVIESVNSKPGCHAAEAPYDGILNLSGNAAEIEDVNPIDPPDTGFFARAPRGASPDASYRCDSFASASGLGVSFRCCADL